MSRFEGTRKFYNSFKDFDDIGVACEPSIEALNEEIEALKESQDILQEENDNLRNGRKMLLSVIRNQRRQINDAREHSDKLFTELCNEGEKE